MLGFAASTVLCASTSESDRFTNASAIVLTLRGRRAHLRTRREGSSWSACRRLPCWIPSMLSEELPAATRPAVPAAPWIMTATVQMAPDRGFPKADRLTTAGRDDEDDGEHGADEDPRATPCDGRRGRHVCSRESAQTQAERHQQEPPCATRRADRAHEGDIPWHDGMEARRGARHWTCSDIGNHQQSPGALRPRRPDERAQLDRSDPY